MARLGNKSPALPYFALPLAGWKVNTLALVASTLLAAVLIFVGFFLYKEDLSVSKIAGIVICLVGLYFINK